MGLWNYLASPFTWLFFVFGALIGSFLNVCILRIPEGTFFKSARSRCRHCNAEIPFYLNVPVFGYLYLRGKTKCCNKTLSHQYPLVELGTGLLFVLIYWEFPFIEQIGGTFRIDHASFLRFDHAIIFACALLVCSVIDLRHMIIPDVISIPMILLSPAVFFIHPDLDWMSSLIGVVAGGLSLYLVAWLYWLIRREVGLGLGDVKLLAAIGGWLGYQAIVPTIFVGSILGAIFGVAAILLMKRLSLKSAIPFGPFLAVGALLHLLYGDFLREWLFVLSTNSPQ